MTPPDPLPPPTPPTNGVIVVTDRHQAEAAGHSLVGVVSAAVDSGARIVLFREKDLARPLRADLAAELLAMLRPVDGTLLIASAPDLARELGASGVHLAAADAPVPGRQLGVRDDDPTQPIGQTGESAAVVSAEADAVDTEPRGVTGLGPDDRTGGRGRPLVVGRSCHSVDDVVAAQGEGCDYATLSPIWATASKPGYGPALGPEGLAAAHAKVPDLPVVALGGVEPGRAAECLAAGAAGVAVMGAVMRADDPGQVVRRILEELR